MIIFLRPLRRGVHRPPNVPAAVVRGSRLPTPSSVAVRSVPAFSHLHGRKEVCVKIVTSGALQRLNESLFQMEDWQEEGREGPPPRRVPLHGHPHPRHAGRPVKAVRI